MSYQIRDDIRFDFRSSSVLMIDRSECYLDILAEMLLGFGFSQLSRSETIDDIIDKRSALTQDFILIEPQPDCDAAMAFIESLRRQDRAEGEDRLMIIMTGAPSPQVVAAAQSAGADYVLAKPFSPKTLLERILWVADMKTNIASPGVGAAPVPQNAGKAADAAA